MKPIKIFVAALTLSIMSSGAFAQSISVTAPTLDSAEAEIAAQAEKLGMSYKITGAHFNNHVYMVAELRQK